jgi:hypothetical protein
MDPGDLDPDSDPDLDPQHCSYVHIELPLWQPQRAG